MQRLDRRGRSAFVTGLAVTFIVIGALSLLSAGMHFATLGALQPAFDEALASVRANGMTPVPFMVFLADNLVALAWGGLVSSAITLVVSIGLLVRAEWARIAFVLLMALSGIGHLVAAYFLAVMRLEDFVPVDPHGAPMPPAIEAIFTGSAIVSAIMAAGFALLYLAAAKALTRPQVRAEFGARREPAPPVE